MLIVAYERKLNPGPLICQCEGATQGIKVQGRRGLFGMMQHNSQSLQTADCEQPLLFHPVQPMFFTEEQAAIFYFL